MHVVQFLYFRPVLLNGYWYLCIPDQTEPIKTSLNDAYAVTCPTKKNKAYIFVEVPHHYEVVDGPNVAPPVSETINEAKKYVHCQSA